MARRTLLLLFILRCCIPFLHAQNTDYALKVVNTLCSEEMAGRGYVNDGADKAANFIASEFRKSELLSFGADYFQHLGYPVIAFPYEVSVKLDGEELIPGEDFIVGSGCTPIKGVFDLVFIDSVTIDDPISFSKFEKTTFSGSVLALDIPAGTKLIHSERLDKIKSNGYRARCLVFMNQEKLTWGVSLEWDQFPKVFVKKGAWKGSPKKVSLDILPEIRNFNGKNVIGYQKGTKYPDSFIVFSAHYDHLGMMGRWALFPGANDNASGVAMMLDLMHHYKENPPPYSVCFIAFTGEEAGLIGSYYYTENPLFPLNQISMLINLDLMATGDKGMTVVNATLYPKEFQDLKLINITGNYLPEVYARDKAKNSDHYYFSEKGVKAFFFYLMGTYNAYHDVYDTPEAVTFSKYPEAFRLIRDFADEYQINDR